MKIKVAIAVLAMVCLVGCTSAKTISEEEAKKKALAIQDGEVVGMESDLKDDDPSYTFTIKTSEALYEIEIDAVNGKMISQDMEMLPSNTNNEYAISEEQARQIALDKVPGATIVKVELDNNDGQASTKYEIELLKDNVEYSVDVDVTTGNIVAYDEDRD